MRASIDAVGYLFAVLSFSAALYQLLLAVVGALSRKSGLLSLPLSQGKAQGNSFLVLVPAHNEGDGVAPTIASLLKMNYPAAMFRLVVIADNCDDDTADIAKSNGAEVWVRNLPALRGKGQALSWAFARSRDLNHDAVVIIDADTTVHPDLLGALDAALTRDADKPGAFAYQARYDFLASGDSPAWLQTVGIAAKAAENSFIHRARTRLNLTNLLQGNGFCLPKAVLERVPWAAHSIVEDAEYAVSLALHGVKVSYLEQARVASRMASTEKDSAPQKVRWAKGMFLLIGSQVPRLISAAIRLRRIDLFEVAIMLLFTSRLMTAYLTSAGLIALLFSSHAQAPYIGGILAAGLALQMVYVVLVFKSAADEPLPMANLLLLPRYLKHLGAAQFRSLLGLKTRQWTRTVR